PARVELDAPFRIRELQLLDDGLAEIAQVHAPGLDREPAAQATAGEIEEVSDHARHPLGARQDSRHGARLPLGESSMAQQELRGDDDRRERVAQIVPNDADELLAEPPGL